MGDREQDLPPASQGTVEPVTRRVFWIAQALWWGTFIVVYHLASLPHLTDTSLAGQVHHVGLKVEKAALGFAATLLLVAAYRRIAPPRLHLAAFAAVAFVLSYVLGVGWELGTRGLYGWPLVDEELARDAMLPAFVLMAWSAVYVAVVYQDRAARADALAAEAQLAMLRYQVNPHFLFNALNSLRALIDEEPARARQMVTELAELFRHSLRTTREGETLTVADELAAVRSYLDIQHIRFDDALEVAIEVEPAAAATPLPSFVVHPLVENAIKYGLETSGKPLRVRVSARREGARLVIQVANTGTWLPTASASGTGTGLRNLRERLRHLYRDRHRFTIGDGGDGWVRATIEIEVPA
jgi:two-component system LytT family sensor kinase